MTTDITSVSMKEIHVKRIEPLELHEIYQSIALTLPEGFYEWEAKLSSENKQNLIIFAASMDKEYVGILTIQMMSSTNAHISWMEVGETHSFQRIATKLLLIAENFCYEHGYSSLTVETLTPQQNNSNNYKLYHFFKNSGFKVLFDIAPFGQSHLITYLSKMLNLNDFSFIDLTHSLSADVPHWGIDVGFKYNARYVESGDSKFRVQRLEMSAGIGTHMDAPSHCFENAPSIDAIPLQSLITVCRVIDVSEKAHERYSVTVDDVLLFENEFGVIPKGAFVIIYTGWDKRWDQPEKYRNDKIFPSISLQAAELLISREIAGLGIDTLSPDAFGSDFPVHQLILSAGKYIIENVANASQLDPVGCYTFALPIKIIDGTEAPIRLIGMKRK